MRHLTRRIACPAQIEPGCAQEFGDAGIATEGALHQPTSKLVLKIVFRTKPAFEHMLLPALEIQNLHDTIIGLRQINGGV